MQPNKLKIGWFSFTCSSDNTIVLTELLNEHFDTWKRVIDFVHVSPLKTRKSNGPYDISFVEGAISSETQAEKLKKIREASKFVVAVGACAVTGLPSSARNSFLDSAIDEKIQYYFAHFDYNKKVTKLSDIVKIDDEVPSCPMDADIFIQILEKYLKLFQIT